MPKNLFHATGKRKSAVARVWMKPGNGVLTINKKPLEEYMSREADRVMVRQPLVMSDMAAKWDISVNVRGGGVSGQAGAVRHGIARALVEASPELRDILKKNAFLTRDSRMKERKKYGLRGARAAYQYSKR
jgi:small subunit ribosomal protein S9